MKPITTSEDQERADRDTFRHRLTRREARAWSEVDALRLRVTELEQANAAILRDQQNALEAHGETVERLKVLLDASENAGCSDLASRGASEWFSEAQDTARAHLKEVGR